MARTAPVPNIPPIPGMCPSIAVLGGGAGGGGGSGNGAGDGDGSGGAGGDGSGDNAAGDGTNAGGCGPGATGSCTSCSASPTAGDPVEIATGRVFTLPFVIASLPGPLHFDLRLAYTSNARDRDVGFGFGWLHTFAYSIELRRAATRVHTDAGTHFDFELLEPGQFSMSSKGWLLERRPDCYVLHTSDRLHRVFRTHPTDTTRLVLERVEDQNRNATVLTYDRSGLRTITDSAGRVYQLARDDARRVTSMLADSPQGQRVVFGSFLYGQRGDLETLIDLRGSKTRFGYDERHLMTRQEEPGGLVFQYRYDSIGRCVETWGAYPDGRDLGLAKDVPDVLRDGTKAKGIFHTKLEFIGAEVVEAVTSTMVQRVHTDGSGNVLRGVSDGAVTTRKYDAFGMEIERTSANGGTTRTTRDGRGRILAITDPTGRTKRFERDAAGSIVRATDAAGNAWELTRDSRGNITRTLNPKGGVTGYVLDERGLLLQELLPNGGQRRFRYDAMGNLVELIEPNGAAWRYTYDYFGDVQTTTDPAGGNIRYLYERPGIEAGVVDASGATTRFQYDAAGNLVRKELPDGRSFQLEWGGYRKPTKITRPDGIVVELRYDREMRLVTQIDGLGQRHERRLDARGNVVAETSFDGRTYSFRRDAMGQLTAIRGPNGTVELEYDAAGRQTATHYPDGTDVEFRYNARGDLVTIAGSRASIHLDRDELGNVLRETQDVDGESYVVEFQVDVASRRVARKIAELGTIEFERDGAGRRTRTLFDGTEELIHHRDLFGREIARSLPAGGLLGTEFDEVGRIKRRWVEGGKKEQLGRGYRYSALDELVEVRESHGPVRAYEYDRGSRLTRVGDGSRALEAFGYDAANDLFEDAAEVPGALTRRYGTGGRLEQLGDERWLWDRDGRLSAKVGADGRDKQRFEWSASGQLASVHRNDGTVIRYAYDAFGRRLAKWVTRPDKKVEKTRFIWEGGALAGEVTTDHRGTRRRSYLLDDGPVPVPMAQRDDDGQWRHYVVEPNAAPTELVAGNGTVVGRTRRRAWGEIESLSGETTPFSFAGQYRDEDVGLHYNYARYYDPAAGVYISADPLGPAGDLNAYRYCTNPVTGIDPLGLAHNVVARLYHPNPDGSWRVETLEGNFRATTGRGDPSGHSEAHVMRCLEGRTDLDGTVLNIESVPVRSNEDQAHSCPGCSAALDQFARDNNMRVAYRRLEEPYRAQPLALECEGRSPEAIASHPVRPTTGVNSRGAITPNSVPNALTSGSSNRDAYEAERARREGDMDGT